MFTELGKFLRKLRIDRGEILKNMADKLGFTSSYLSAIECGKRNIPSDFVDKIIELYELDESLKNKLIGAKEMSLDEIRINMRDISSSKKSLALQFARSFDEMDDNVAQELLDYIHRSKKDV